MHEGDSVHAMLVLGLVFWSILHYKVTKYEQIVELVNSGIEGSCNPTQLVVFIIQQEGVESSIYLFILLCDQCWECPLVKV